MNSSTVETIATTANAVSIGDGSLTVALNDGRVLSVPLAWYPRLLHGKAAERGNWRLVADGRGIHWPDLDEDIRVADLMAGVASGESQQSLARWLDQRRATRLKD